MSQLYCCSSGSAEVGAELSGQPLSMSTHVLQHGQPISCDTFGPLVSLCAVIPVCAIHGMDAARYPKGTELLDRSGRQWDVAGGGLEAIMTGVLAALECSHSEQV